MITDSSSYVVNFSRKPPVSELNSTRSPSLRTDSLNDFYDDTVSSVLPHEESKEPAQYLPMQRFPPMTARKLETYNQDPQQQRGAIPYKAARRLGVDDRRQGQRLAHIEEVPSRDSHRPESATSSGSGSSKGKGKRPIPQRSVSELEKFRPVDWSQSWSVFWRLTPDEARKPPSGYSIGQQELWWKLLQLEENYQQSLEMLHNLISSDDMSLPPCGITPLAIKKLQLSHDKYLRQPLRTCMAIGPWTFEFPAIVKAYQNAHAHLVPLYERYSWDLPLVTFQVAASSTPASSASRDLLTSIGPGMPTRYTCFRSPLTHVCSCFDTIQALYDGLHKGGPHAVPNFAQVVSPVREQLRSLIASCNRNILLRWDDFIRSYLFGCNA